MPTADITIIGGGILGISTAYQLAMRGAKNILVLEKESIAHASSGRGAGGIRQQFADKLDIRFSQEGVRFYKQFTTEGEQGRDKPYPYYGTAAIVQAERPHFYQYGYLFLITTPESWQNMQQHVALQQSLGVPTQLLSPQEVHKKVPQLVVDDVIGATFCPTDGYSDPPAMTRALAYEAQLRGVVIREHTPVVSITVEDGRVQAVHTPHETITTPLVLNAAGAYSALVAQLVGITDFPVRPLRRQIYLTEPFDDLPYDVPMTIDLSTGFHFRRRGDSVMLIMPLPPGEEEEQRSQRLEPEAFDLYVDDFASSPIPVEIRRRCPTLAKASIVDAWAGLYEMTPDEHPVLGKTEVEGFLCACGFSGHGFMHAPMAAKLMTELILDGTTTTLNIGPFSSERFRTGKLLPTTRLL